MRVAEQRSIVRYVQETLEVLGTTSIRAAREASLLREYRTKLIADVVTGKLDVRAAAAALPEEPDDPDAAEGDCPGTAGRDDTRG